MEFKSRPPGQQPGNPGSNSFRGRKPMQIDARVSIHNSLAERGGSKPVAERMKTSPEAVSHVADILLKDDNMQVRSEAVQALALAAEMKVQIGAAFEALNGAVQSEGFLYDGALRAAAMGILNKGFPMEAGASTGFDILAGGLSGSPKTETLKTLIMLAKKQITIPPYVLAMAKESSRGRTFMDSDVEKLLIESAKNEMRPFLATKPLNGEKLHAILVQADEEGTLPIYNQALNSMTHHGESGIVKENARFALDAIRPAK